MKTEFCLVLALAIVVVAYTENCPTGWEEVGIVCCRDIETAQQKTRCVESGGVLGGGKCFITKDKNSTCNSHLEYVERGCAIVLGDMDEARKCIENFDPNIKCYISEPMDTIVMMTIPGFSGHSGK